MKNIINSINKIEFCYRANKQSTSAFYLQNFCSTGRNTKSNKTKKKNLKKKPLKYIEG